MDRIRNVGILLFDEVEVLDFAGPFEVFSVSGRNRPRPPFNVFTVAQNPGSITCRNGLSVNPRYHFLDCPTPEILVIPGGWGTRKEMENESLLDWVRGQAAVAEVILSVCTGALILGKAGLLNGLKATTHYAAMDLLKTVAPLAILQPGQRVLDNGHIVVAAGVSAGIDASFHLVARLLGPEEARETAHYIEYDSRPAGDLWQHETANPKP